VTDNELDGLCGFDGANATAARMVEVFLAGMLGARLGTPREMWLENANRHDLGGAAKFSAGRDSR
jgi:hypothetical protein